MYIDLAKVDEKGVVINDNIEFNDDYIKNTPIQKAENIHVEGRAYYSVTNEIVFDCKVNGSIVLLDALTLEPCDYPIDIEISEVLSENASEINSNELKQLDIMDILW